MQHPRARQIALGGLAGAGILTLGFAAATLAAFRPSDEERQAPMPGDAFVPLPLFSTTHAVTIEAPPERVWPWIAQMGARRGGWYSHDFIDNGRAPSATTIRKEWQHLAPGDLLPALPGAKDAFIVLAVTPDRDLVLGGRPDEQGQRATWEFNLRSNDRKRTRLLVRGRVAKHWLAPSAPENNGEHHKVFIERVYSFMAHLPQPVLKGFAGFGHRVMQNAQLRGIKQRAESMLAN